MADYRNIDKHTRHDLEKLADNLREAEQELQDVELGTDPGDGTAGAIGRVQSICKQAAKDVQWILDDIEEED